MGSAGRALSVWVRDWLRNTRGQLTLIVALMAPPMAVSVMLGVEIASLGAERQLMQQAADSAALAAARDQTVAGGESRSVQTFVQRFAISQLGGYEQRASVQFTAMSEAGGRIRVTGTARRPSFFGNRLPSGGFLVQVEAVAEAASQVPICIVSLAPTGSDRFTMRGAARVAATGCLVHSNKDILTEETAHLQADVIQATGITEGSGFSVAPNTGALRLRDPFQALAMPSVAACTAVPAARRYRTGTTTLPAGLHCDHIIVERTAVVRLGAGDHVFRGRLIVQGDAAVEGEDVALIFMNRQGDADFNGNARVNLSGRRSGPYAGFVMIMERGTSRGINIRSGKVDRLLGTVYASHGAVRVSAAGNVAEESDWSVVVANRLHMEGAPTLVINTRYEGSPVPVPGGVGSNLPGTLRLVQ
jgi:hypothetical protein